eukprot:1184082-Prorocentrum_minimum.AAC.4
MPPTNQVNPVEEVPTDHSIHDGSGNVNVWSDSVPHPLYVGLPCVPCCVIVPKEGCPGPCKTVCCDLPIGCIGTCILSCKACRGCVGECVNCVGECVNCVGKCVDCAKACVDCPAMVCSKITCGICCGPKKPKKPKKTCCERLTCGKFTECSPKCCLKECCGMLCGPICKACLPADKECSPKCCVKECCGMLCGGICKACLPADKECSPKCCVKECCGMLCGPICKACCPGKDCGCTDSKDFDFVGEYGYGVDCCAICHVTMLPFCCACVGPKEDLMMDGSFEYRTLHMDRMPQRGKNFDTDVRKIKVESARRDLADEISLPQTSVPADMAMQR